MDRKYTYAELCRMTKKRVLRIAGYKNIKAALNDRINQVTVGFDPVLKKPIIKTEYLSKKYMARMIASDR